MRISITTEICAADIVRSLSIEEAVQLVKELDTQYGAEDFSIGVIDLVDKWMEDLNFAQTVALHRMEKNDPIEGDECEE